VLLTVSVLSGRVCLASYGARWSAARWPTLAAARCSSQTGASFFDRFAHVGTPS
jgi:hypothetical protein